MQPVSLTPVVVGGLFLLFLVAYGLYSTYAVHHLSEFGYSGVTSQRMLRVYLGFSALVLIGTAIAVVVGILTR